MGLDRITAHVSACYEAAYRGLESLGYSMATPFDTDHRCASFLVRVEGEEAFVDFLAQQGVYISTGRPGYARISVAPFTNQADIRRLLDAARAWHGQ